MRKYLLGLFAVVMAVSLSAFTSAKNSKAAAKTAPLYWFLYDQTSGIGDYLDHGEKSAFISGSCNDLGTPDCRRGYTEEQLVNSAAPAQGVLDEDDNAQEITRQ